MRPRLVIDTGLARAAQLGAGSAKRLEQQRDRLRLGRAPVPIGDALRDGHTAGWKGVECAFALSTGRAGSKTLCGLWGLSPRVNAVHEPMPRLIEVSNRAWQNPFAPSQCDAVYAARDDLVADTWRRGLVWAETNNRLTSLAPALVLAFPAARFVHLWRDPADFLASGLARHWYDGHHWDFARWEPRPDDPMSELWPTLATIDKILWLWAATNDFIADFAAENPDRVGTFAADAMFAGDASVIAGIYAAVGAETPPPTVIQSVLAKQINSGAPMTEAASGWFDSLAAPVRDLVERVAHRLGARAG